MNNLELNTKHISHLFDNDLEKIKSKLMSMGGLVEQQFIKISQAVKNRDLILIEEVKKLSHAISEFEIEIDSDCTDILAIRHPAASDLRFVIAVSRVAGDLENVGSHLNNIANYSGKILGYNDKVDIFSDIKHVETTVNEMVKDTLDAFADFNTEMAIKVVRRDEELNVEYKNTMRILVTYMMEDPMSIPRTLNLFWILHALHRIGEYAREIAGYVIFVVKGNDIRHMSFKKVNQMLDTDKEV